MKYLGRKNVSVPCLLCSAKRNGGKLLKDPDNFQYNLAKKREKYSYYICQILKENGYKVTVAGYYNDVK